MANETLGGIQRLQKKPLSVTASSITLNRVDYINQTIVLDRAAGTAVTLPAANGSGTQLDIVIGTTITSNSTTIKVANSSDIMGGVATMGSSGGTSLSTGTATTSDTITFNGTTSGGLRGSRAVLTDVAPNLWQVEVHGVASGIAVTPFSATV